MHNNLISCRIASIAYQSDRWLPQSSVNIERCSILPRIFQKIIIHPFTTERSKQFQSLQILSSDVYVSTTAVYRPFSIDLSFPRPCYWRWFWEARRVQGGSAWSLLDPRGEPERDAKPIFIMEKLKTADQGWDGSMGRWFGWPVPHPWRIETITTTSTKTTWFWPTLLCVSCQGLHRIQSDTALQGVEHFYALTGKTKYC